MVKHGLNHNHTMYSLHDSAQTPDELVKRAKELGAKNINLTDHGTMLGIEPFMDAGKKYDVNTIPGVEAYIANRAHLVLTAMNRSGYTAISHALRDANETLEVSKYNSSLVYPIMGDHILEKYFKGNQDVFATSACIAGPIASILLTEKRKDHSRLKRDAQLASKKSAYERYIIASNEIARIDAAAKDSKAKRKELVASTSKKQLKRIDALKNADEQITFFKSREAEDRAYFGYTNYDDAMKEYHRRLTMIDEIDSTLESDKQSKAKYRAELKENKAAYEKYKALLEEDKKDQRVPESVLYKKALERTLYLKSIFPNFYIEIQYHGIDMEAYVMPILVKIARETNTPLIAANDAHLSVKEDVPARQLMRFAYFSTHQDASESDGELYLKSDEELFAMLSKVVSEEAAREAIENTEILERCKVVLPTSEDEKHYPAVKGGLSFDELLEKKKAQMIQDGHWDERYEKRLKHEVDVIKKMGFVDYHMVVRDFCFMGKQLGAIPAAEAKNIPANFEDVMEWIRTNHFSAGIGIGPGRGSAAGSLVCYMLEITNIDPIKYDLLFERFLNPERVSMPDIDTDVRTSLRPVVIKYLKWKYGEKAVASIATETTYGAKNAIQEAGRDRASELYDHLPNNEKAQAKRDYMSKVYKLSDMIGKDETLLDAEENVSELIKEGTELGYIWSQAKRIEGRVSGTGIHAGGVVISDNDDINDYIPLAWNSEKQVWATQCDMIRLEEKGMLKMDLLGLTTLDVISYCLFFIEQRYGLTIDLSKLEFEPEVFKEIYSKGLTNSVFQFESQGMKSMLLDFKPDCFEDLILLNAAYRPGPIQYLPTVIARKSGKEPITYKHPYLESILSTTYGCCIYQEQVMQIFQKLAGYSLGQADMVRRAMSKKKEKVLKKERESFINGDPERNIVGCVKNGVPQDVADSLFDEMIEFAKYAFNKSHAAAYSMVSYYTAWLKYHYPTEFLCAMFNVEKQDKYAPMLEDCKYFNIELLPVDINKSFFDFVIEENNKIRYGFKGLKGIGVGNIKEVNKFVETRSAEGEKPYGSFKDFILRNSDEKIPNKKITTVLINSGAFDGLCKDREYLLSIFEKQISKLSVSKDKQGFIRIVEGIEEDKSRLADKTYNRAKEMECIGYIISEDPLKAYKSDREYGCNPIDELPNGKVKVFGLVSEIETRVSKSGNKMIRILLQGKTGSCTALAMREEYDLIEPDIGKYENEVVQISGRANDGTIFIKHISKFKPNKRRFGVYVDTKEKAAQIKSAIKDSKEEEFELIVKYAAEKDKAPYTKTYKVDASTITRISKGDLIVK